MDRLATWTAAAYESVSKLGISFTSQFEGGLSAQYEFIKVYLIILVISFIATSKFSQE
jgi:ABC-type enterochelin transport system permease subunit